MRVAPEPALPRFPWPLASLRTYLIAAILVAALPTAAYLSLQIVAGLAEQLREIDEDLDRSAALLAGALERDLAATVEALQLLSQSESLAATDLDRFATVLRERPQPYMRPRWTTVVLLDADGVVLLDSAGAGMPAPPAAEPLQVQVSRVVASGPGGAAVFVGVPVAGPAAATGRLDRHPPLAAAARALPAAARRPHRRARCRGAGDRAHDARHRRAGPGGCRRPPACALGAGGDVELVGRRQRALGSDRAPASQRDAGGLRHRQPVPAGRHRGGTVGGATGHASARAPRRRPARGRADRGAGDRLAAGRAVAGRTRAGAGAHAAAEPGRRVRGAVPQQPDRAGLRTGPRGRAGDAQRCARGAARPCGRRTPGSRLAGRVAPGPASRRPPATAVGAAAGPRGRDRAGQQRRGARDRARRRAGAALRHRAHRAAVRRDRRAPRRHRRGAGHHRAQAHRGAPAGGRPAAARGAGPGGPGGGGRAGRLLPLPARLRHADRDPRLCRHARARRAAAAALRRPARAGAPRGPRRGGTRDRAHARGTASRRTR